MAAPTIVITGASRRLGLHLTRSFARKGWKVIAVTRFANNELLELETHGVALHEVAAYNASHAATVGALIAAQYNRIDALIHNASLFEPDTDHEESSDVFFEALFQVHMAFPNELSRQLSSRLASETEPGNIIHITDVFTEKPSGNFALYCATKAGMESLTKSFAIKYAPGIRVNSIAPGPIQFLPTHDDDYRKEVLNQTLLKQEGGFQPIYQAVCSIIENPYMTGSNIKVDGGRSLKGW